MGPGAADETADDSRTVRVFISSTFLDMQRERDELVRKTFPALRARFRARGVEVLEIDLRWGITQAEAQSGRLLPAVLAEIDRCRPYFIGLLGQRYGWTPPEDVLTDDLKATYPAVEDALGRSITEIEILHGALRDSATAERALFFERDPGWAAKQDDETRCIYEADTEEARAKLAALKDRIRKSGASIITYESPEDISSAAEEALSAALDARFPKGPPDPSMQDSRLHAAFARERRNIHIGAESYLAALDAWLDTETARPILITGESGSGKSSLIANWAHACAKEHPDVFVLEHYLGASPDSADAALLIRRLWEFLNQRTGEMIPVPAGNLTVSGLEKPFIRRLEQAARALEKSGAMALFALDGLDKLVGGTDLRWLPVDLPPRVKLVASSLDSDAKRAAQQSGWLSIELRPLRRQERFELIEQTLESWGKHLSPERVARILDHPQASTPLFLKTVLDELRYSGTEASLDGRLDYYLAATSLPDLFARLLQRLESDCGTEIVSQATSLIWASRGGLEERRLIAIMGIVPLEWATLRNGLADALRDQVGRLTFSHDFLADAVVTRYLPDEEAKRRIHARLACRYLEEARLESETQSGEPVRRCHSELLYHLRNAQMWNEIVACLEEDEVFARLPKRTFGVEFDRGTYYVPDPDALDPVHLDGLSQEERETYGIAVASAFGEQARRRIRDAHEYPQPWPETAERLRQADRIAFAAYRDTFYDFTGLSNLAAVWAYAAAAGSDRACELADEFMQAHGDISGFLHYLTHFGASETGLSHALEDNSTHDGWKRLSKLRRSFARPFD